VWQISIDLQLLVMRKQLLCESPFISSWIIHQICLFCRTIETNFNYKRMISYENVLNKKLLDGNSEMYLLPWIRSRYFNSTRRDKIDFIVSQQVQYSWLAFIPMTSDFTYCTYWKREMFSVFIFVTLQKSRVPKATLRWFSEPYLLHNMHQLLYPIF